MEARSETPEFTEKQEVKEDIGWHAICTTAGGSCTRACAVTASRKRRNQGSREGVVPVVVEEEREMTPGGSSRWKNEKQQS